MQIQSTQINQFSRKTQTAPVKNNEGSTFAITDAVDIGADTVQGAIPLYGAYKNLEASLSAGIFGDDTASNIAGLGFLANVAGTISLGAGLALGSTPATLAGSALLVASGVTHATANNM